MAAAPHMCNMETHYGTEVGKVIGVAWPKAAPYHRDTIEFWRSVQRYLESADTREELKNVFTEKDYEHIRQHAYRGSNRTTSSEVAVENAENAADGSDI